MDPDELHAPLLGGREDERGRALSVSALAPRRASSSSLRDSEVSTPRPPSSARAPSSVRLAAEGVQEADGEGGGGGRGAGGRGGGAAGGDGDSDGSGAPAHRGAGLRFASMPPPRQLGGPSRGSSISSMGGSGGKGGLRYGSFSRDGGARDVAAVLHRSASHKVRARSGGEAPGPLGNLAASPALPHAAHACLVPQHGLPGPATPPLPLRRRRRPRRTPPRPAPQLLQLSEAYSSRRQLEEEEGITMPPWVIHPYDVRWVGWWGTHAGAGAGAGAAAGGRSPGAGLPSDAARLPPPALTRTRRAHFWWAFIALVRPGGGFREPLSAAAGRHKLRRGRQARKP
jgi:hypothetical protein